MDAQRVLPWGTWATKARGDPCIKAPWQLLPLNSPLDAIHSPTDWVRQDKAGMSQQCPRGLWVKTMSKESTYSTGKTEMLGQTGDKCLQSSGNQKGNVFRSSGGEQCLPQSKKLHQVWREEQPEEQRRRGEFFLKATFHVFSV